VSDLVRPRVVFSRCLGFDRCRYNGQTILDPVAEEIKPFVEAVTVCPEVAIGLGVPRPPIRLVKRGDAVRLYQPETQLDITDRMDAFCEEFLGGLAAVDGFVLKYRSPSCGPSQVKVYHSTQPNAGHEKGSGAFATAVLDRFGDLAVEDEGRLRNFDIRQHFLTKLFALARLRNVERDPSVGRLVTFHARHKLLLMAYNQTEMRAMGRIVANPDRRPVSDLLRDYRAHLAKALSRAPRRTSAINVLMHGFGYVSDELTSREKRFFLDALDQYRAKRVPLGSPLSVLRSWILRFGVDYLEDQVYFEPFPAELVEVLDSGKGRSLG